uniref:Uncharacterized protein n=1 Tax=Trichuris muris TaxID=70415 RepID=A0A5S6QSA7_TRIMR
MALSAKTYLATSTSAARRNLFRKQLRAPRRGRRRQACQEWDNFGKPVAVGAHANSKEEQVASGKQYFRYRFDQHISESCTQ